MAALTIPTLVGNYKKQVVVSHLKKFYSTFNNAVSLSTIDNGDTNLWDITTIHQNNQNEMNAFVKQYLYPYFKGIKTCEPKECMYMTNILFPNSEAFRRQPLYIFNDGSCFSMLKGGSTDMHIIYDINCIKGPNAVNRDQFAFTIIKGTGKSLVFKPGSTESFSLTKRNKLLASCKNETNSPHAFAGCAALIFFDGWKIAPDYPFKL